MSENTYFDNDLKDLELNADFGMEDLKPKIAIVKQKLESSIPNQVKFNEVYYALEALYDIVKDKGVNVSVIDSLSNIDPNILTAERPIYIYTEDFSANGRDYALEHIDRLTNSLVYDALRCTNYGGSSLNMYTPPEVEHETTEGIEGLLSAITDKIKKWKDKRTTLKEEKSHRIKSADEISLVIDKTLTELNNNKTPSNETVSVSKRVAHDMTINNDSRHYIEGIKELTKVITNSKYNGATDYLFQKEGRNFFNKLRAAKTSSGFDNKKLEDLNNYILSKDIFNGIKFAHIYSNADYVKFEPDPAESKDGMQCIRSKNTYLGDRKLSLWVYGKDIMGGTDEGVETDNSHESKDVSDLKALNSSEIKELLSAIKALMVASNARWMHYGESDGGTEDDVTLLEDLAIDSGKTHGNIYSIGWSLIGTSAPIIIDVSSFTALEIARSGYMYAKACVNNLK